MQCLRVRSKSEVRYIPYRPGKNERIDLPVLLKINFNRTLLVYRNIPFLISTGPVTDVIARKGRFYHRKLVAKFSIADYWFFDHSSKKPERLVYGIIGLDSKKSPRQITDVLFFHELREMYYRWGRRRSKEFAHKKARRNELQYAAKFLLPAERRIYQKFRRAFRPSLTAIRGKHEKYQANFFDARGGYRCSD